MLGRAVVGTLLLWPALARATVFTEDFEGDTTAWDLSAGWEIADCGASRCLRLDVAQVPWPAMATATLTTPIGLADVTAAGLWMASRVGLQGGGTSLDVVEVQRSADGGASWLTLARGANGALADLPGLALAPGAEPEVLLRFVFRQADWSEVASVAWEIDDLVVDSQPFAVLVPQGGVELPGGAEIRLAWGADLALSPLSFDLEADTEQGTLPIVTGLPADARSWSWTVPDVAYASLSLRVITHTPTGDLVATSLQPARVITTRPAAFEVLGPAPEEIVGGRPLFRWGVSDDAALYTLSLDGAPMAEVAYQGVSRRLEWTPPAVLQDGPHTWGIVASDWSGHAVASGLQAVFVAPEPPQPFALLSPADGAWVRRDVVLSWGETTDEDAGLAGFDLYLDGVRCQIGLHGTMAVLPRQLGLCSPTEGEHTWVVVARDGYDNPRLATPEAGWRFRMDAVAPAPPLLFAWLPTQDWTADPAPLLSWDAAFDGESGLAGYEVWVDGAQVDLAGPSQTSWPLALTTGEHTAWVKAVDVAGNRTTSTSVVARLDDQPPSAPEVLDPLDCALVTTPQLCWTPSTDAHSGVAAYELWIDNALALADLPPTLGCATPTLAEGVHTWQVVAIDGVGHRAASDVGAIAIAGPGTAEQCDGLDTDCDGVITRAERDADADGFRGCARDCDDNDAEANPGAVERCNGADDDCDGVLPADEADADLDGVSACAGDCDDADPGRFVGVIERCNGVDDDCDGVTPADESDRDADGARVCGGDCADRDATRAPGMAELCNAVDDDCSGAFPANERDLDGDGVMACAGDCDDRRPAIRPGAAESCNRIDDDCDGQLGAGEVDADRDGVAQCEGDCDDGSPGRFPGAVEACDGLDNDCDGAVPGDEVDLDGDGARACLDCLDADAAAFPGAVERCNGLDDDCSGAPDATERDADLDGVRVCAADCDDHAAARAPGLVEACDGVDNDCDGVTPPGESDQDGDGRACAEDCDDATALVFVGAAEVCDGLDDDCDGLVPVDEVDADDDGVRACALDCDDARADVLPGAPEVCDGVDNDCDPATFDCPDTAADESATPDTVDDTVNDTVSDTPVDTVADTPGDTDAPAGGDKDGGIVKEKRPCGCASSGSPTWALVALLAWRRRRP